MQTTHLSVVSVVLVAKAAPNADVSLIWLHARLEIRFWELLILKKQKQKTSMQTTHYSALSVVLIAKAAPNADMSLIWFSLRLQGR